MREFGVYGGVCTFWPQLLQVCGTGASPLPVRQAGPSPLHRRGVGCRIEGGFVVVSHRGWVA